MEATKKTQYNVRLDTRLRQQLHKYAKITGRTPSSITVEAISSYLDYRIPQIIDLAEAIKEADAGRYASDAEVNRVFAKYGA